MCLALFNLRSVEGRVLPLKHKGPRESMHYTSEKASDSKSIFLISNVPVSLGHLLDFIRLLIEACFNEGFLNVFITGVLLEKVL